MLRLLFVLITVFTFSIGSAQEFTLSGKCVDRKGTPIENVKVIAKTALIPIVYTDENGVYDLKFSKLDTVEVEYRVTNDIIETERYILKEGITRAKNVKFDFQQEITIQVHTDQKSPFELPQLPVSDVQNLPMGSIPRYLLFTTAATSNNELTSNYNVRGGNYDENLVYVNGFLINRPFLTRSGQQEGMSFINTALVESIQFSAGGFDSEYGDKLSSVLDIKYKTPTDRKLHGSVLASLLNAEAHVEQAVGARFNYLVGARYQSNGYFLNSLPTKGAYNPVYWDAQLVTNFAINENVTWSVLGHFSSNNYRFTPQSQETDFGTANEAYSFRVYYEGQENTKFTTMTGGTSLKWKVNKKTNLDLYATVFNSVESESFDILGEYFINELETDPSKEEFGDSIAVLGVGGFLNHARNRLHATIINLYHNGDHTFFKGYKDDNRTRFQNHGLKWGVNFQMDDFTDKLSEWKVIDSAGYSIPQSGNSEIILFESIKSNLNLQAQRYTGFMQFNSLWSNNKRNLPVTLTRKEKVKNKETKEKTKVIHSFSDTIVESPSKWALSAGFRTGYTTANNEFYVTPRASVKYYPRAYMVKDDKIVRRDMNIHLATGMYYQPPFYREFRTFEGDLNLNVKAQKSFHTVVGTDVYFRMWNRDAPFKFTAEAFYKYMWDVNPYEVENVRTRYYADNNAKAYAVGLDLNVHGEFVEGIESFFKIGFLSTKEDILDDYYYNYFNSDGVVINSTLENQTVVDSVRVNPGYIPRPTDQMFTLGALIQDRMPNVESLSVQVGLQFGSRLPYGPPDENRYKDTLRQKSYFRVDLGTSYDFLYKRRHNQGKGKENFFTRLLTDAIISFEVFNLLGVNNVLSKQWIQDVEGKYYSIPNYLTQRRFNLKLILRF